MKTLVSICITLISLVGFSQNGPIDFEPGGVGAGFTWTVFENDSNLPLEIVANPDPTGANISATVAKFTALQTGAPFAGVESMHGADVGTFTLDASNAVVSILVWKTEISDVGIKFATASNASFGELKVANTVTNQWEELFFDFTSFIGNPVSIDMDQVIVFPDFQTRAQDNIVYFDNIVFGATPPPASVSLPISLEGGQAPMFGDFNGSSTQIIANPDAMGVNTSANVAENVVPANAAFAGVNFPVTTEIDITTDKMFTMNVWSPLAGTPILLKLENATTAVNAEREVTMTTTGAWEEVTFDFSSEGALTFESVTIFMNFNMTDAADQTYYWDNIFQMGTPPNSVELPVDFEDVTNPYQVLGFEGADSAVEANPVSGGINTSATVLRTTKAMGAQFFAGTTLELDAPIDFSSFEGIAMKTYSPKANIPVRLKLENADASQFVELDVNTTVVDEWEELVWDFSGMTAGVDFVRVIVFFEFIDGLMGDGSTYYYDDIEVREILSISDNDLTNIVAYPNPVSTTWNVTAQDSISKISVFNILGQMVITEQPNVSNFSINMETLEAGIYIATVTTAKGSQSIKLIKK